MKLSCGILVLDGHGELLLCHATGTSRWDIPKGGGEPGETPIATAIRETAEETGLRFEPEALLDLGRHAYRPGKDLHLFGAMIERIDLAQCSCSTHYRDALGRERPEMDGFAWVPFDEVPLRCAKNMTALLGRIGLHALTDALAGTRASGPGAKPADTP